MKAKTWKSIPLNMLAIFISLIMFVPIYLLFVNSLKDGVQARAMGIELPTGLHLENYLTVVEQGKLGIAFVNSMLYATGATLLVVVFSTSAAFVLSRNRSRRNRFLYFFLAIGIAMPINYVTLTKVMQTTQLINTVAGIILLYAATKIPFAVFLIYAFVESIPREIDEAAIMDGCSPFRLFFAVIFPLLTPAWVTTAILSFLDFWSEFILPLYFLQSSTKWPMTLAVYNFFGMFEANWNLVSADIVLTILPVIVVYLIGQRYIVSGMTTGAVKG
ncbi:MAG TPA: carbohydrate ABC transporter permease [Anaerolineales bacterium]|nr:carbohydrate ABC transporter permease [Anaerolineales bacterium]